MSKTILVAAVHPDDETLGCGGTIHRHLTQGDQVHWLVFTGVSDAMGWSAKQVEARERQLEDVARHYGFHGVHFLGFPAACLDEIPTSQLVQAVGAVVRDVQPEVMYLPFYGDVHSDHRVAFDAAMSCSKGFRYPSLRRLLMMETLSETDYAPPLEGKIFAPNVFVDVSAHMEAKLAAMRIYEGEIAEHPFPRSERSILAQGTLRGAACGCEYAESFMLLKDVEK